MDIYEYYDPNEKYIDIYFRNCDRQETIFKVTNDRYSQDEVTGTWEKLQSSFDDMGWNVKLVYERGLLIDELTGEVVAIPA